MSCRRPCLSGPACAWTPHRFFCGGFPSTLWSCRTEVRVRHQTARRGSNTYFPWRLSLKFFPQVDNSARQQGFEIRVFPLLGELPKAIEPHLPACQLNLWQLGLNMWSSPTNNSLDPITVTVLRVGFPGESHGPATCGSACNCPEPEAWTTEASGRTHIPLNTST